MSQIPPLSHSFSQHCVLLPALLYSICRDIALSHELVIALSFFFLMTTAAFFISITFYSLSFSICMSLSSYLFSLPLFFLPGIFKQYFPLFFLLPLLPIVRFYISSVSFFACPAFSPAFQAWAYHRYPWFFFCFWGTQHQILSLYGESPPLHIHHKSVGMILLHETKGLLLLSTTFHVIQIRWSIVQNLCAQSRVPLWLLWNRSFSLLRVM